MKTHSTPYVDLSIKEGILHADFRPNIIIDLPIAKKLVESRLFIQEGKDYPTLMTFNIKFADKSARDYMNNEGLTGVKAGAFIVTSLAVKTFVNFYLSMYKPKVPAKFFTDRETAVLWLKQYADE